MPPTTRQFISILIVVVLGSALLCGCWTFRKVAFQPSDPGTGTPEGEIESPYLHIEVATLGPGDIFTARVFREDELSGDYMVGSDGLIDFPLLGKVKVAGLTPSQTADMLTSLLGNCCLREASVNVLIKEYNSKKVYIFGQVQKPGTFPYEERMTIVQAITMAGGFTRTAWRSRTNITRVQDGQESRFTVPIDHILEGKAENLSLFPGDIVYIPESIF